MFNEFQRLNGVPEHSEDQLFDLHLDFECRPARPNAHFQLQLTLVDGRTAQPLYEPFSIDVIANADSVAAAVFK